MKRYATPVVGAENCVVLEISLEEVERLCMLLTTDPSQEGADENDHGSYPASRVGKMQTLGISHRSTRGKEILAPVWEGG